MRLRGRAATLKLAVAAGLAHEAWVAHALPAKYSGMLVKATRYVARGRAYWVLASSVLALGCGTDDIELRPASPLLASPAPSLDVASPMSDELGPADVTAPATAAAVPGRDGVIIPSGQLPGAKPPGPASAQGCQKVDFLFVIDDSSSMRDEQANLARSFPGFIQIMKRFVQARDFHIMVVSTGGSREEEDEPSLDPEACDDIQGAGKRRTPDGVDCGIQGGLSYMVDSQPELEATFSCVAQVGTDGSAIEEPMDALLAATGQALNAEGRCNAGFLRDDAILVVTLITDEDDRRSSGDPEDWQRLLLEAKRGDDAALVLLGLVGDNNVDGGLLGGPCSGGDADGSPRLQEFVESVNGIVGSVCAPEYADFFQTAVGTVDSACDDFVPPSAPP
jgi:hypothetical protein